MKLIIKVLMKSKRPTANNVSYSRDPTRESPRAAFAMKPVIVWAPSSGLLEMFGLFPAASATIMVSPTAREIPSTTAAAIPENAAGNTTRNVVCILFAPSAKDP